MMNITQDQADWAATWIEGWQNGTLTSIGGFINKLGPLGFTQVQIDQLKQVEQNTLIGQFALVMENIIFNDVPFETAVAQFLPL